MTESKMALLVIKDTVENLDHEDKVAVMGYMEDINAIIAQSKAEGQEESCQLAMTVVGLEMAVELGQ